MDTEKYLVLNKYFLSLFGVSENRELQIKFKDTPTNIDTDGKSHFVKVLNSAFDRNREILPADLLYHYDENIKLYVAQINHKRTDKIQLKYFQYLAVLFNEIFLDNHKNRKKQFLSDLNEFLNQYRQGQGIKIITDFTENDLTKIACWMATGAGKTLIMHINYYQFFHYKVFQPNNILLITPTSILSEQHYKELISSGIPARLYEGNIGSLTFDKRENSVLVIEITKFVSEEKGAGATTIPPSAFEGPNLVFIDEGHKGKDLEQAWRNRRKELAKDGFTFEYSATFKQILSEQDEDMLQEYGKAIIFDYSYEYFYLDGYGKGFSILNVHRDQSSSRRFQEIMFVANLLSYYEQLLIYDNNKRLASEYNIEKPLWIFVGTTVTGKAESDIEQIVKFIAKAIQDQNWLEDIATKILKEDTGITKEGTNEDIFKGKFGFLKENGLNYRDLYIRVFNGTGAFKVNVITKAEGELGLKVGENEYFGVINVGDVSGLKNRLEHANISVDSDSIESSLFDTIKTENSKINVLIGAKKFIEGWDTWRVSSMGLLNIGKGKGPQIIQLFGRGIRLKGKVMSLKRSEEKGPIQFLETLNIFSIKAEYLESFLDSIFAEGVEYEEIDIPIITQYEDKWKQLYIPKKDDKKDFKEEKILNLEIDQHISCSLDLLPRISELKSRETRENIDQQVVAIERTPYNLHEFVELFDWDEIYNKTLEYKIEQDYWNLIFSKECLRNIILSDKYTIYVLPDDMVIKNTVDLERIQEIALQVIKSYIYKFYRKYQYQYETEQMQYDKVTKQEQLVIFEKAKNKYGYRVRVKKRDEKGRLINQDIIKQVKELVHNIERLVKEESSELPRVFFTNHLYLPILLKESNKIEKISPSGLEKSEKDFIIGLREYIKRKPALMRDTEVYLLRNFPKSGIGFYILSGFYPDFIMWLKKDDKQKVVFIDPHGLGYAKGLEDEKIIFCDTGIKELEQRMKKKQNGNIELASFILTPTRSEDLMATTPNLTKEDYKKHNVLFFEDNDWAEQLFKKINANKN